LERIEAKILYELARSKKNFWELLEEVDAPLGSFLDALKKLVKEGFIALENSEFYITEKGKARVNPKAIEFEGDICPNCLGKRIVLKGKFEDILETFKQIVKKRPGPTSQFFQAYMLESEVVARVALMHYYGDLAEKSIVIIGDDDLLSVALALTGLPSKIVVLDIDTRLGEFLNAINRDYGFNIDFFEYDVSNPLPEELRGRFDVFSSEPLETVSGLKAFILRGLSCLKKNGVGYVGLTTYEASLKKWLKVQEMLNDARCVITDIIKGFSVYPPKYDEIDYDESIERLVPGVGKNPGVNWYKSALIRFELMKKLSSRIARKRIKIDYVDSEEVTHPDYIKKFRKDLI
jgi:predicted methyltransferase